LNINFSDPKYLKLIKSIRFKRRCVIAVMIIAILACLPTYISFGDKVIIDKAFSPWLTALLVILCVFVGLIAYGAVSVPLVTAMDKECDPEKHLVLNTALYGQDKMDHIFAVDHLYLGNFSVAFDYATRMTTNAKPSYAISGHFNKARCAFMLGDKEGLNQSTDRFSSSLSTAKLPQKSVLVFEKMEVLLKLMCAVADNDIERIEELRGKAETWSTSVAATGFVNYIKGIAAVEADDKVEAVYRLKLVTENCPKTVFASLSAEQLSSLKL